MSGSLWASSSGANYETYLPTLRHSAQAHSWFSRSHENTRWARRDQCASSERPRAPGGLTHQGGGRESWETDLAGRNGSLTANSMLRYSARKPACGPSASLSTPGPTISRMAALD